jgi:hypothetical protein
MMTATPELRFLSENECPNAGPDWMFGKHCAPGALTIWGYCGTCWLYPEHRIPPIWIKRVEDASCPSR